MLYGDFNRTRFSSEKLDHLGSRKDMDLFFSFVRIHALVDLPLADPNFTWSNKRDVSSFAWLDRFLMFDDDWEARFPLVSQSAIPTFIPDHGLHILL